MYRLRTRQLPAANSAMSGSKPQHVSGSLPAFTGTRRTPSPDSRADSAGIVLPADVSTIRRSPPLFNRNLPLCTVMFHFGEISMGRTAAPGNTHLGTAAPGCPSSEARLPGRPGVGSKLKCPLFVAGEMSGFKVVPSPFGLGWFWGWGCRGRGSFPFPCSALQKPWWIGAHRLHHSDPGSAVRG